MDRWPTIITGFFRSFAVLEANYRLTIIDDEEIPLAVGNTERMQFLPIVLTVMVLMLLMLIFFIYRSRCLQYQMRIQKFSGDDSSVYNGWNLKKLREVTQEVEMEAAGRVEGFPEEV